jgi:hypothetical protein
LPQVQKYFRQTRRDVNVTLHANTSNSVEQEVAKHRRTSWRKNEVRCVAVYRDCRRLRVARKPLACHGGTGDAANPHDDPFVSLCHGDDMRTLMDLTFKQAGIERKPVIKA